MVRVDGRQGDVADHQGGIAAGQDAPEGQPVVGRAGRGNLQPGSDQVGISFYLAQAGKVLGRSLHASCRQAPAVGGGNAGDGVRVGGDTALGQLGVAVQPQRAGRRSQIGYRTEVEIDANPSCINQFLNCPSYSPNCGLVWWAL